MSDWKEIEGFPEWIVSKNGVVINNWTHKVISQRKNQQGLTMVNLWQDGNIHTRLVSLLVAHAFLDAPPNANYNSVIHLNGDRSDCRALNLMWRPRWFAVRYHKMFEDDAVRVAVHIPDLDKVFYSLREFCTTYGLVERDTYLAMLNRDPCFLYGWKVNRYEE